MCHVRIHPSEAVKTAASDDNVIVITPLVSTQKI